MPRTHGRIWLSIWSDEDWLALPMHAQWFFTMAVTQADINHAGVLSLATRRWTALCANRDPELIADAMKILAEQRFIVVDEDTEQVLVRSFIRRDDVWKQPNTLKSACTSIMLTRSRPIRAALLAELRRLDHGRIERLRTTPGHEPAIVVLRRTIDALVVGGPPPPDTGTTPSDGYDSDGYDSDGYDSDPITSDGLTRTRAGEGDGEGEVVEPPDSRSGRTSAAYRAHARSGGRDHPPPAELNATAHSPTGYRLVADWATRTPGVRTGNRRELGRAVDALLAQGADPALVPDALDRAHEPRWRNPVKALPHAYDDARRAAHPPPVAAQPTNRTDRKIAALLAQDTGDPPARPLRAIGDGTC